MGHIQTKLHGGTKRCTFWEVMILANQMALYRKWRPLLFSDVVGQEHITSALRTQVSGGRISHAYLFTGTRGTGKTTCAKILARAACCEHPVNGEPCNECPSCRAILEESASDFSEIDAASNNGVDNVREIREQAQFSPAFLSRRVYIIDEVHMLSQSAFNALLKTLEEPPEHVLFILATTEVHKIPATILSRCQRYDFHRITPETIADRLKAIAKGENYSLTDSAAAAIARLGDGSMRDAISLYDRCMPYDGTVDDARVCLSLGLPADDAIGAIFKSLLSGNAAEALSGFADIYNAGNDIITFFDRLLSLIRDIFVIKLTKKPEYLSGFSFELTSSLAQTADTKRLEYFISCVGELLSRVTRTSIKRTDAELCLFKMSLTEALVSPAPAKPVKTAEAPKPAPVDIKAPAEQKPASPPVRTENSAPTVPSSKLKNDFEALVLPKVHSAVKIYLPRSEISAAEDRIRLNVPEEAFIFMSKEATLAIFREAAIKLGYKDITVTKKAPVKQSLEDVLNNAKQLGIPITEK